MGDRCATVLRPLPIGAAIARACKRADFIFVGRVGNEIHARRQRTGQQERAVHGRQFALRGAPTCLRVEKVEAEALVLRSVCLGAL